MKITKSKLKQIIKEELEYILKEEEQESLRFWCGHLSGEEYDACREKVLAKRKARKEDPATAQAAADAEEAMHYQGQGSSRRPDVPVGRGKI